MSHIWTNFTSPTAKSPLELDPELFQMLRVSMKDCARSSLPPLEQLYHEAKLAVEEQLATKLYPEFVKYQLSRCMRDALAASLSPTGDPQFPYPGLGSAFCITDLLQPNNPIVYVSDGLLATTGFGRQEVLNKGGRLFQGAATSRGAIRRLSEAVSERREASELIANHKADGTPWWNLLLICPLPENERVRYFFGAQVNVSGGMGLGYREILRVLDYHSPAEDPAVTGQAGHSRDTMLPRALTNHQPSERGSISSGRTSRRYRLFRYFTRKSADSTATSEPSSRPTTASNPAFDDTASSSSLSRPVSPTSSSPPLSPRDTGVADDPITTPYTHFIVLRCATNSNQRLKLLVLFCSSAAQSLLLNTYQRTGDADVTNRDIFSVLHSAASLKTRVLDKIAAGEQVSAELAVTTQKTGPSQDNQQQQQQEQRQPVTTTTMTTTISKKLSATSRPQLRRTRTATGLFGTARSRAGSPSPMPTPLPPPQGNVGGEAATVPRRSEAWDRGAERMGRVWDGRGRGRRETTGAAAGTTGPDAGAGRMVSHWVPLKDGEGRVGMVVLVLVPPKLPG
jgi:hypothetical protein